MDSFTNNQRAQVLTEALPYIRSYNGKIVVVKYGGNAMVSEQLREQVMEDMVLLWLVGVKVVLVHGGGPEITDMMNRLGKKPKFIDGLRVTDQETVDIAQMVLAGKVNKTLVKLLEVKGGKAMGISGMDGGLIEARMRNPDLGFVGSITGVKGIYPGDLDSRLRQRGEYLQHQRRYGGSVHCRCAACRETDHDDGYRRRSERQK